jgi:orotate phosphoribosyltransferase
MKTSSEKIAEANFDVGGITLSPKKPYTWASGYKSPIYNDNRKLLSEFAYRMLVTDTFVEIIKNNGLEFDMISGTTTAGIAPAASLAQRLNVPMIILSGNNPKDGKDERFPVLFDNDLLNDIVTCLYSQEEKMFYDAIASTVPIAIPYGVNLANRLELPFMYVRPSGKAHGLENTIEGVPKEGQTVLLLSSFSDDLVYIKHAFAVLKQQGLFTKSNEYKGSYYSDNLDINGKKILQVEDLLSTSKSGTKEILRFRELGAIAHDMLAIFSYGLEDAEKNFREAKVNAYPALTYDTMLQVGINKGLIKGDEITMLKKWRELGLKGWHEKYTEQNK